MRKPVKYNWSVVLIVMVTTIFQCGIFESKEDKKYDITAYQPYQPGDKWYYSNGMIKIVTHVTKIIDGISTMVVQNSSRYGDSAGDYVQIDSKGLKSYGSGDYICKPPYVMAFRQMKMGETITQHVDLIDTSGAVACSIANSQTLLLDNDAVVCKAGKFKNCLKMQLVTAIAEFDMNDTTYVWYVKNLGEVQIGFPRNSSLMTLDSAWVNGKRYPAQ
jgi:hypothetical protein